MVGHIINPHGIPAECPHCGAKGRERNTIFSDEPVVMIDTVVVDHDFMWHDGKVVCAKCHGFIRHYDAG